MKTSRNTRFDIRLARKQKEFFEYAATLGGFKTLTEFVIYSGQQQANQIVDKHNAILASERDREIFFEAIMKPQSPNTRLKNAAARYKTATLKKPSQSK